MERMLPILSRQGTTENKASSPCFPFKKVFTLKGKAEQDFLFLIFIDPIWVTVLLSPSKTKSASVPDQVCDELHWAQRPDRFHPIYLRPAQQCGPSGRTSAGFLSSARTKLGCFRLFYVSVQNK
jgi:hypothetical protein